MIELEIPGRPVPWPRRVQTGRGKAFMPEPYRSWREAAQVYMQTAMSTAGQEIISDYVHLKLVVFFEDHRRGDLDNYEKAVNNAAEGIILVNDKQVISVAKWLVLCPERPRVWVAYRTTELEECEE